MNDRALRAALWASAAFAVAYLLSGTLQFPVLVYDPVHRVFGIARTVSGVSMRYYGDLIVASAAALAAAALAYRVHPARESLPLTAATTLSLVALDVFYYLSRLYGG
jgi:hypothetical protein